MVLTYNTPTAEQLDKLSRDVNRRADERLESDCKYLLNSMNRVLTESLNTTESFSHSVNIDTNKLNSRFMKLEDCTDTKYNIIQEMKNVGVNVGKTNSFYGSSGASIHYRKITKSIDVYM